MSGVEIKIQVQNELTPATENAAREVVNALRRSVDKTARAARKETIKTMSRDIGVPASKFRDAVPLVRPSTQANISASWTISKKPIGALNVGTFTPGMSWNRGSYSGSTFRLTGGGSASLNLGKAFVLHANGGTALMIRQGSKIKPIYIEMPNTGMSQSDGAPRKDWEKVANRELAANVGAEVQRALAGQVGPSPGVGGGE